MNNSEIILKGLIENASNDNKKLIVKNVTKDNTEIETNSTNTNNTFLFKVPVVQTTQVFTLKINLDQITSLNLSSCNLSYIPKSIYCKNLNELDISFNKLNEVPDIVKNVKTLCNLNISHNFLKHFNSKPMCSVSLRKLDISYNLIENFPIWILSILCDEMEVLNLNNNPLQINSILHGRYLKKLHTLEMNNCNIHKNNFFIKFVTELPRLKHLYLSNNNINSNYLNTLQNLPFKEFASTSLTELYLSGLGISNISEEIISLNCLEILDLKYNYISWLPNNFTDLINLKVLDLSHNDLISFSIEISKLKNLKELHINDNHLGLLPKKIVELKCLEILDCYNNDFIDDLNIIDSIPSLIAIDFEQNYFQTPKNESYFTKRGNLRKYKDIFNRVDSEKVYESTDNDENEEKYFSSEDSDNAEKKNLEIIECQDTENWDSDSVDSINDDMNLNLPPYKFQPKQNKKKYDPSDYIKIFYFEDAVNDPT